jgi:hypothetical protein
MTLLLDGISPILYPLTQSFAYASSQDMFKTFDIALTAQSPTLAPTGLFIKYTYIIVSSYAPIINKKRAFRKQPEGSKM